MTSLPFFVVVVIVLGLAAGWLESMKEEVGKGWSYRFMLDA